MKLSVQGTSILLLAVSCTAHDVQEALANTEVIIQEWIETAKALGRPVPEPKGRLTFA